MATDISKLRLDKRATAPEPGGARPRTKIIVAVALVLAAAAALYFAVPFSASVSVAPVTLAYPYQGLTLLNASGYVVAQRKAAVASKVTSRLVWLGVEEGSRVKEGEVIARLENDDKQALLKKAKADQETAQHLLEEAQAELTDATVNHGRLRELLEKKVLARSEFDIAEARLRKARAVYERAQAGIEAARFLMRQAEAEVEYTLIRAPFNAVVLTKSADVGDIVTPLAATANAKASVVSIADLDSLMVEVDVSESNIEKVKPGAPCVVTLDAIPGDRFEAAVHMVVPTADRTKATVLVKVKFVKLDPRILPEMSAKVAFLERPLAKGEDAAVLAAPKSALVERGGRTVVFAVEDGRAVAKPVTAGPEIGDLVRLTSGVAAGEKLVLHPGDRLSNGDAVRVDDKG